MKKLESAFKKKPDLQKNRKSEAVESACLSTAITSCSRASGYFFMSTFCIIPASSCGMMWQWKTSLPLHCLNLMRIRTSVL